jgi:hypothetical protein
VIALPRKYTHGAQYLPSLRRAGVVARTPATAAIKVTERAILSAAEIPGPLDYEVGIPPVHRAWCRRIPGHNLWLLYRVREDVVFLLFVLASPPIPLE